jgi:flagellin-specific chaperone FliS
MLAHHNPREAYRRVAFDARVAGAGSGQLVLLCFEQLDLALGSALLSATRRDNAAKSQALTRALSSLTALQLGIDREATLAPALRQFYEAARARLLDNVLAFDPEAMRALRGDFAEIAKALAEAGLRT